MMRTRKSRGATSLIRLRSGPYLKMYWPLCQPPSGIASDQSLGRTLLALNETGSEFDAANTAIIGVRAISSAGVTESRIENIFPMFTTAQAIVDNERQDDFTRSCFAVGNIFAPKC